MNYSNYTFNLDMQSNISQVSLPVRVLDTGRKFYIGLTDGGSPYIIKDGCRAVLFARKADGNTIVNDCIIENNTQIVYELTTQTTSCAGVVDCEIRLYGASGKLLTSPRFIMVVDERVVYNDEIVLPESESTTIDSIIISEFTREANEEARKEAEQKRVDAEKERITAGETALKAVEEAKAEGLRAITSINEAKDAAANYIASMAEETLNIVQFPGESITAVMSQKAVAEQINNIYNGMAAVNDVVGTSFPLRKGTVRDVADWTTIGTGINLKKGKTYKLILSVVTILTDFASYATIFKADGSTYQQLGVNHNTAPERSLAFTADDDYENMTLAVRGSTASGITATVSLEAIVDSDTVLKTLKTAASSLDELVNSQKNLVFGGDYSGTTYQEFKCDIPAGMYNIYIDNYESSDTDDTKATVVFIGANKVIKDVCPTINKPWFERFELSSPADTIRFYASYNYQKSVGDTFSVTGLKITGDNILNERISNLEESIITLNPDLLFRDIEQSMFLSYGWNTVVGEKIYSKLTIPSRAICERFIKCPVPLEIIASDGFQFVAIYIDNNDIITGESQWQTNFTISPNQRFALCVWKVNGDALTEDSIRSAITLKAIETKKDENDISNSLYVEYGRYDGATYNFVRIPKISNNGDTIKPVIALTSVDGSVDGAKCSTLTFSKRNNLQFVINAGLFDVKTMQPIGQTIIDGVSIVNEPHPQGANGETISDTECYPLCIDADGNLSAPYDRYVDTATMIADGVKYATSGWTILVDNFEIAQSEIDTEFVHKGKNYSRQCIGQFENGDYCVLTSWGRGYSTNYQNEAGLTYEECAQILVDHGVKFAYSLDGGGSAETVIKRRQINPIYEGENGRSVPSVIYFTTE